MQFHSHRVLTAYSGLDVARIRAQEQIGGDLQLGAEVEVSMSAFQVIVKRAAAGGYLVDQKVPLIGGSAKPGNLRQMPEGLVLSAGQRVTDGPAERVGDCDIRIWAGSGRQLFRLGLERGQRVGDRPGPIAGWAARGLILGFPGVAGCGHDLLLPHDSPPPSHRVWKRLPRGRRQAVAVVFSSSASGVINWSLLSQ